MVNKMYQFKLEHECIFFNSWTADHECLTTGNDSIFLSFFFFFQLQDFINSVMKDEALPWSVKQAIEKVKVNIQWRKMHEKDVETWLMKFFNPQLPDFSNSK